MNLVVSVTSGWAFRDVGSIPHALLSPFPTSASRPASHQLDLVVSEKTVRNTAEP